MLFKNRDVMQRTDVLLNPVTACRATSFVNLEPLGGGCVELVTGACASGHVGHQGTYNEKGLARKSWCFDRLTSVVGPVAAIRVTPGKGELATRLSISHEGSFFGALSTQQVLVGGSLYRIDRRDLTDRRGGSLSCGDVSLV